MSRDAVRAALRRIVPTGGETSPVDVPAGPDEAVRRVEIAGRALVLGDVEGSVALDVIASEIGNGAYDFSDIDFRPGDVVIDIGAHVGSVSIWLALAHPFLRILAFEPVPDVYEKLERNIRRNGVANVAAFNRAVTADGRDLDMVVHLGSNTGGGTAQLASLDQPGHDHHRVASITLDDIFAELDVERCKLLKIDCEGSEHEVLLSSRMLSRVDHLRGEFHENTNLRGRGYSMEALQRYCERYIEPDRIRYVRCQMAE